MKSAKERADRSRTRLLLLKVMYRLVLKYDAGLVTEAEKDALKQLELIYDRI